MKALVYRGPGLKALGDRPKPKLQAQDDAIVKIVKTTICGTDLHILKGDVPSCTPGRILGHEGIGVVESVGPGCTIFKPGNRALISCISSCSKCEYCRSKKIDPATLITHRFSLDQLLEAYETFANAAETKALKVLIAA